MFVVPEAKYGSKFAILLFIRITISPPYCGLPSLSHQFPVDGVDVGFTVDKVVEVVLGAVAVTEVVNMVVWDLPVTDVDVVQEAKINDVKMREVSTIQINPLFISSSY
jgi:hypothetical protein